MIAAPDGGVAADKQSKSKAPKKAKVGLSAVERLSEADLQTLRLDEVARVEFDARVQRFGRSRADLKLFEAENVETMDDARYDELSAAQARQLSDATAVVHFIAPRVLRMREGEAKRKWRSFVTKFRKDEMLA